MTVYSQALNEGLGSIKTAAHYNTDIGDWAHAMEMWIMNASGVWVPLTLDASGKQAVRASEIEAQLTTIQGYIDGLEAAFATLNSKDFATQTTLAAVLAKLSADPATQTTLAAILTQLATTGLRKIIDPLPAGTNNIGDVDVVSSVLPAGSSAVNQGTPLTMTGTALQLSSVACRELLIQADPSNSDYVYIGNANTVSASVYLVKLTASGWIRLRVANANLIWAYGMAGNKISYGGEV